VSWGDARAAAAGGEETMTVGGDEEGAAADTGAAAWFGSGAPLLPFVVIREEPDVAFGDGPLAVDGDDLVAPREDEGRAENDDGPEAFDFPLSVE